MKIIFHFSFSIVEATAYAKAISLFVVVIPILTIARLEYAAIKPSS